MKLKELESHLSTVENEFDEPKIALEQYPTSAHLAARMLFVAAHTYEDIEGLNVLDLGCGTGILSIGSGMLQAATVVGMDCDPRAIEIARNNAIEQELELDFVLGQVPNIPLIG